MTSRRTAVSLSHEEDKAVPRNNHNVVLVLMLVMDTKHPPQLVEEIHVHLYHERHSYVSPYLDL